MGLSGNGGWQGIIIWVLCLLNVGTDMIISANMSESVHGSCLKNTIVM